jgi:CTP:molybdopterin cytidylyltransferase MocA
MSAIQPLHAGTRAVPAEAAAAVLLLADMPFADASMMADLDLPEDCDNLARPIQGVGRDEAHAG